MKVRIILVWLVNGV